MTVRRIDMWTRIELKERAKEAFARCRWIAVAVSLIFAIVSGGGAGFGGYGNSIVDDNGSDYNIGEINIPKEFVAGLLLAGVVVMLLVLIFATVIRLFVRNPIEIGARRYFLLALNRNDVNFREIVYSFSNGYIDGVVTMFLRDLYIFLWSLLLIVPGIIKAYEYRMVPYIIAENPNIDRKRAFELSKMMMDGEKWDTFVLDLSFIPWNILSAITLGLVGIFYTLPYYNFTHATQYEALRDNLINNDPKVSMDIKGYMDVEETKEAI